MYKKKADGGRHWVQLDSTWKTYKQHYDDHKERGYEVEMGYGRIIERPDGKFYQLTEDGFKPAVPIPSGEAKFESGNNPTIGFDIIGSAFDNVVPFGQQLRHKLGLDFANENSETYNRFGTAATIVQLPFIFKSLPKFGSEALTATDDVARNYSVAFQFTLDSSDFGRLNTVHFNRANAALSDALAASPEFAKQMDNLIPSVSKSVSKIGGRSNPTGWTWHHAASNANTPLGVLQLVPTAQHRSPLFRNIFHPNRFGGGGYAELQRFRDAASR